MKTEKYYIQGMHCRSCELLIAREIGKIKDVDSVEAHFKTGAVKISYENKRPSDEAVRNAVHAAGYTIGLAKNLPLISHDQKVWFELVLAICLVFIGWMILKLTGISSLAGSGVNGTSALGALIIGLTAGISSCMALVGGLVVAFSAQHSAKHPEATAIQKFQPHIVFNAGRVLSFVVLGGAIGGLGSVIRPSISLTGWMIIIAGIVMLALGLSLTKIFPRMTSGISLPAGIARRLGLGKEADSYSHKAALFAGAATFFLPCGFTQAMQIAAIGSGSVMAGAVIMGSFAVGTMPGLLGVGGLSSVVKGQTAQLFFRIVGVAVIVLGFWNISNGLNLTGISLSKFSIVTTRPSDSSGAAQLVDGKQVIKMQQWAGGYNPRLLTVKVGIPVRWEIDSVDQYSCASSLAVPALGLRKSLQPGLNVIEFTPTKTGTIRFTCSMGMFSGSIEVIE